MQDVFYPLFQFINQLFVGGRGPQPLYWGVSMESIGYPIISTMDPTMTATPCCGLVPQPPCG